MSEWIRCVDRLPPAHTFVLACGHARGNHTDGPNIDIWMWDGDDWWDDGGTELPFHGDPTHWMPLPETPKESR